MNKKEINSPKLTANFLFHRRHVADRFVGTLRLESFLKNLGMQDFRSGELDLFPRNGPENPARDFEPEGTRARKSGGNAHHSALRWTTLFVQRCIR
jgi:hypothetical protein